jgi:hypothetical protein
MPAGCGACTKAGDDRTVRPPWDMPDGFAGFPQRATSHPAYPRAVDSRRVDRAGSDHAPEVITVIGDRRFGIEDARAPRYSSPPGWVVITAGD